MFPHTVTLYNVSVKRDENFHEQEVNNITILRGVLLSTATGVNKDYSEGADNAALYIPTDVKAVDGKTGRKKEYISPKNMDSNHWTLEPSRSCFFVKGEVVEDTTLAEIEKKNNDVYVVSKVGVFDYGGDMRHFEVGGK